MHTFDLVVLAAEWGHGRRRGWLSNLHLGARDPRDGGFVMVGKTFKGLTDELLTWQTEAFLAREIGRDADTVHVRPDLVVEVAIDGVQASTPLPGRGGAALRPGQALPPGQGRRGGRHHRRPAPAAGGQPAAVS